MIILVSGKMGSGKSTLAKYLADKRFEVHRFADPVYQIARDVFGMVKKDRSLLQGIGKKMREIDPDVYAKAFIRSLPEGDRLIVADDLRFLNEMRLVTQAFGDEVITVRLEANEERRLAVLEKLYGKVTEKQLTDISETALDDEHWRFDVVAVNDYKDGFAERVWEDIKKCAGEG